MTRSWVQATATQAGSVRETVRYRNRNRDSEGTGHGLEARSGGFLARAFRRSGRDSGGDLATTGKPGRSASHHIRVLGKRRGRVVAGWKPRTEQPLHPDVGNTGDPRQIYEHSKPVRSRQRFWQDAARGGVPRPDGPGNRHRTLGAIASATLALAAWLGVAASPAAAADFIVKNCADETPAWSVDATYEGGNRVEARHCNEFDSQGQFQLNGRPGPTADQESGSWVWQPGAGAGVIGGTINARLRNAGGWAAQLYAVRPGGTTAIFGTDGGEGGDPFQNYAFSESDVGGAGATRVVARLKCFRVGGCDLAALAGASNKPESVLLTVRDSTAPFAAAAGPMLDNDAEHRWHHGTEQVSLGATDTGGGVAGWSYRVNGGSPQPLGTVPCAGDRGGYAVLLQPCPSLAFGSFVINTAAFSRGAQVVEFCAFDYAAGSRGTPGCTTPYLLPIDNAAPLQPESLQVAGGAERWHADNDFDVTWSNPAQASDSSPIAAVHYRLLNSSGTAIGTESRIASPVTSLTDLQVPASPGLYNLEVWLEDEAGNVGAPARVALRFDDQRPGAAAPLPTPGWISRTEIPLLQRFSHPVDPLPLSGIEGYAYEVDAKPESDPCGDGDRCTSSQTDLKDGIEGDAVQLSALPEGLSFIHSAAVSGSGMESSEVGHAQLLVDRTDPTVSIAGLPPGWVSGPVALTAQASDALSGMAPEGAETPYTAIQVDDAPPTASAGANVSVAVTGEGVHRIAYFARDLAGNVNDGGSTRGIQHRPPGVTEVRIDRTSPGVAFFNAQDPNDPELIRAAVSDRLSGPAEGKIEVHRVGSGGPFVALPTELVDGELQARWTSDDFPAGEYEFRADVVDHAGNSNRTANRINGGQMLLSNPIKLPTAIRASFGSKRARISAHRRRTVPYGRSMAIHGRLTAGPASPLSDQTIRITERFRSGARKKARVTFARTDRKGLFVRKLRPGPSRSVIISYPGTRTLTRSRSRPLQISTRTRVVFKASSSTAVVGGRPIVFSGRVLSRGAHLPPDGKEIELQYQTRSVPWTTFSPLKADSRGRFRFSYSFSDDESRGVHFSFRALATRETGWPYAPAASRIRRIVGR